MFSPFVAHNWYFNFCKDEIFEWIIFFDVLPYFLLASTLGKCFRAFSPFSQFSEHTFFSFR